MVSHFFEEQTSVLFYDIQVTSMISYPKFYLTTAFHRKLIWFVSTSKLILISPILLFLHVRILSLIIHILNSDLSLMFVINADSLVIFREKRNTLLNSMNFKSLCKNTCYVYACILFLCWIKLVYERFHLFIWDEELQRDIGRGRSREKGSFHSASFGHRNLGWTSLKPVVRSFLQWPKHAGFPPLLSYVH